MYARLDNNIVQEIIAMDAVDFAHYFPADFRALCVECGPEVQQQWTYDGETFSPPPAPPEPTLEEVRADAMEKLRLRKWQAKDAGITVNGIAIDTDDKGQATINGAVTNVILDPTFTAKWKTSSVDEHGQSIWIVLDATMIVGLSKAMTVYTEACFNVEADKQAEIAALPTVAAIREWLATNLDTGWPDQVMTLG